MSAAALGAHATPARALDVFGALRPVPGSGGCVRDLSRVAPSARRCPGAGVGLQGAQALLIAPGDRDLYVAAPASDAIVTLSRAPAAGTLRPARSPSDRGCVGAPGSGCSVAYDSLGGVDALAVSPDGRYVYAGAQDSAAVSTLARGDDGLLTPLAAVVTTTVGGRSRQEYGCVQGQVLPGAPSPGCATTQGALEGVDALAATPDGRNLYAASYGSSGGQDSIVAFARDARTGALTPLRGPGGCLQSRPARICSASEPGLEGAAALLVSPDGRFLYVAAPLSGAVAVLQRNRYTGRISALTGAGSCVSAAGLRVPGVDLACALTAAGLAGARALALSPDGRELYVAAFDPGAVVALARDPKTGRIAPWPGPPLCLRALADASCPSPLADVRGAAALALSPDGRLLFVAGEGADSVVELLRNPADGALSPSVPTARDVPALDGPAAIATSTDGRDVYVASPFDDAVAALAGG